MRQRAVAGLPGVLPVAVVLALSAGLVTAASPSTVGGPPASGSTAIGAGAPGLDGIQRPARRGATITLDRGALRVRPTGAVARITRSRAVFDARHADSGDGRVLRVAFGAVTVTAAVDRLPEEPGRLPVFRGTPSWVVFLEVPVTPCPISPPGRPAPPPAPKGASRALVLLVDARTGAAAVYGGAGSSLCVPNASPYVAKVAEMLSVPWTWSRPMVLAVRLPGCSRVLDESATGSSAGTVLEVAAQRAFGPCGGRPRTVTIDLRGAPPLDPPIRHARTGPILAGRGSVRG